MSEERLLSIRCPGQTYNKKTGELVKCNRLCVRVLPGSAGECQCQKCKMRFRFSVDSQARSLLSVKAQPIPQEK